MNKIKTIKEICDKYHLSHRQLGILMGYHRQHIQKIGVGKRRMTDRFATRLEEIASCLRNGNVKIPE